MTIKESININDLTFKLKPVRTIFDIDDTLNLQKLLYDYDESTQIWVTNSGSVVIIDAENDVIFYNDINMYIATK